MGGSFGALTGEEMVCSIAKTGLVLSRLMSRIDRLLLGDRFSIGRKELLVPSAGSASMVMYRAYQDKVIGLR
jgi:hypothetical protein